LPNLVVTGQEGSPLSSSIIKSNEPGGSAHKSNPNRSTRKPKPSVIVGGATSAYLAISCDTTDNDGLRDASNDNESASQGDSVVVE